MANFEVLIDDTFANVSTEDNLFPIDKKRVRSIVNGFEDGKWRFEVFEDFIWDNITETALSATERASLSEKRLAALRQAARKLRLVDAESQDKGEGSEIAEIALYGIMKNYYKALPVVPKIFQKQNSQDFAKGSDSVHIVVEGSDFSIWFGEAKFYSDIEDARLGKIIDSVEESLKTEKLKKENSIITNLRDLWELDIDPDVVKKIVKLLSSDTSIDEIKPKLHIPILLLHQCEITGTYTALNDDYRREIREFHCARATAYFKRQITRLALRVNQYSEIKFHILLFPVPSKEKIVNRFTNFARFLRDG